MNPAWLMVAVCTAMVAMAFGAVGTVAVFLEPIAAEFGWPRATTPKGVRPRGVRPQGV